MRVDQEVISGPKPMKTENFIMKNDQVRGLVIVGALLVASLAACGGPKTSEQPSGMDKTVATDSQITSAGGSGSENSGPGLSFEEALKLLQAKGEIPVLDRTDSIAGVDANGDEVRDDIGNYINGLPDTEKQKKSLVLFHKALNKAMLAERSDRKSVKDAASAISLGIECLSRSYKGSLSQDRWSEIRKMTVNTPVRFQAYARFNSAMSGSVIRAEMDPDCE